MTEGFDERGALSGKVTQHYRIGDLIGAGGMGEVYRATDTRLHRTVAIKSLLPRTVESPTGRDRFIREARLAGRVSHPYVATTFDVIEHEDQILLVMEYLEGRTLEDVLRDDSPSPEQCLAWAREIAEALQAIHDAGVIHRDLKPGNVMVMSSGHIKLMDFGLARRANPLGLLADEDSTRSWEPSITAEGTIVGTLLYMSPEQLRSEELDARSDLFALGSIYYRMLTGVQPFARATATATIAAILNESATPTGAPDPLDTHDSWRAPVRKLLEKQPDRRFTSCTEVMDALKAIAPQADTRTMSRPNLLVVVLTLVTIVGLGVLGWTWFQQPPSYEGPRVALAIVPFVDRTGSDDGALQAGLAGTWLAAELEASHLARAAGPERTTALVRSLSPDASTGDITRRVVAGMTADYVLIGTLFLDGKTLLATAVLEPTRSEVPPLASLQARGKTPLEVAERLAAALRRELPDVSRIDAFRDGRTGIDEITSDLREARILHEQGLRATREGRFLEATERFGAATDADPSFSLAWADLADALHRTGYARRAREASRTCEASWPRR